MYAVLRNPDLFFVKARVHHEGSYSLINMTFTLGQSNRNSQVQMKLDPPQQQWSLLQIREIDEDVIGVVSEAHAVATVIAHAPQVTAVIAHALGGCIFHRHSVGHVWIHLCM